MQHYTHLAELYDQFSTDKTHLEWSDYIFNLLKKYNVDTGANIIDICCGTGGITNELYKKGYRIIGLDSSSDMLEIAAKRFSDYGSKIQLICQDIRDIKLHKKQNAVVCINDGINYILKKEDLDLVFANIFDILHENGIFLFDISSQKKLSSMHLQSYFEENEDSAYIWYNKYDESNKILTMDISLYSQIEKNIYKKLNEIHVQKAYSITEILKSLEATGFHNLNCYDCFTYDKPNLNSDRIQFIAKK